MEYKVLQKIAFNNFKLPISINSDYKYNANYNNIIARALEVYNDDYKEEFIELVRIAQRLQD